MNIATFRDLRMAPSLNVDVNCGVPRYDSDAHAIGQDRLLRWWPALNSTADYLEKTGGIRLS